MGPSVSDRVPSPFLEYRFDLFLTTRMDSHEL